MSDEAPEGESEDVVLAAYTTDQLVEELQRRYDVGIIVLEQTLGGGETGEKFHWFGPLSWAYGLACGAADDLKERRLNANNFPGEPHDDDEDEAEND